MNLHLVGGFLGSGKTTAIIGAAKHLMAKGLRVGVVTNDQGRYLVDTAFFRLNALPAVEVTGGCFCCNYDDLTKRLDEIVAAARPDVVFAESVGSCADLVATVVKPLLELGTFGGRGPASFSAFADARLLRRRLLGLEMPFADDVVYIFDQQIAEAGLLVVNKADLLAQAAPPALAETRALVAEHFPGRAALFQDSLKTSDNETAQATPGISGVDDWAEIILGGALRLPPAALGVDYRRYGAGEARLAWLDEELSVAGPDARLFLDLFLRGAAARLRAAAAPVGHLKLLARAGDFAVKLSLTAGDSLAGEGEAMMAPPWQAGLSGLPPSAGPAQVTLNARVQMEAAALRALAAAALAEAAQASGVSYQETAVSFFHPAYPRPVHHLA